MKKHYKRLFYVFLFVLIVVLMDLCVGVFFDAKLNELPDEGERIAKTNYSINKVDSDIIIIGSSRAETGYNSKLLMEHLPGYSVYNCGGDGQGFFYCNTLINTILDRHVPKYIIWDFKTKELGGPSDENLSLLYPFYRNSTVRKAINKKEGFKSQILLKSNTYRYNATAGRILRAIYAPSSNLQNTYGFGARPVHAENINLKPHDFVLDSLDLNEEKIHLFTQTLHRANDLGCKIIVVISPMYNIYNYDNIYSRMVQKLCETYGTVFFDDSHIEGFVHNNDYAYDDNHLNVVGANIFTVYLSKQLKESVLK